VTMFGALSGICVCSKRKIKSCLYRCQLNIVWQRRGKLSQDQELTQKEVIVNAQNKLLAELAGTRHKVDRLLENHPFIALEVAREALALLEASHLVAKVVKHLMNRPPA
jgi:siroheme synthase